MITEALNAIYQHVVSSVSLVDKFTLETPVAQVPADMKLVDLEKYRGRPTRFRAEFETRFIEQFTSYVHEMGQVSGTGETAIFISPVELKARAIFDVGCPTIPEHRENTATLRLPWSPEWKAMTGFADTKRDQKKTAELIEEWRDILTPIDSEGNAIPLPAALAAIRNVSTKASAQVSSHQSDLSESKDSFEQINIEAQAGQMPWGLRFDLTPAEGLPGQTIYARMSVISGKDPLFSFKILRFESEVEAVLKSLATKIIGDIQESSTAKIFIGEFS